METVFVAMSGGFDSSFAAYLLKKQGYRVVGVTFQLLPHSTMNSRNPKACCSLETVDRARRAASYLSIPHYVLNLREQFEHYVIQRFISEYKAGNTPNPCVLCNRFVKFSAFASKAFSIGAEKIATGHYAVTETDDDGFCRLKKGADKTKDQSYFLYPIEKQVLERTIFPLGKYKKEELKETARTLQWRIHSLRESQDICFIPDSDYRSFLAPYIQLKSGPVFLTDGTFLGNHSGIHLYTIGQRRGINIPYREPLYVVDIRPEENTLIVGRKEDLLRKTVRASEINLLSGPFQEVSGKVRYRQKEEPCTYEVNNGIMTVDFVNPISSVTAGQSLVLYHEETVVGGGIILKDSGTCRP